MISIDRLIEIMNELAGEFPYIAESIEDEIINKEYCPYCGNKLIVTNEDDLICNHCNICW